MEQIDVTQIRATGTPSATTFLSGSSTAGVGAWATPSGSGASGSTTPTASTLAEWDANKNMSANAFIEGLTTTTTAGGTTTLTVGSTAIQQFTGTANQTMVLPTTSVVAGEKYRVINNSTGVLTVQASGGSTVVAMASNTDCAFTALTATPTTPAGWEAQYGGTTITVSAAPTLTLVGGNQCYVFSGSSAATWTLPAVAGNTGSNLILENRGSATVTLTAAGADHIWFLNTVTTMTVAAGGSLQLSNDGVYWNALSIDLVNNTVGILPVPNGGTGISSSPAFRQYSNQTTGISPTAGNNLFLNSFFNVNSYLSLGQFTSAPATANKLTVTNAGLYMVTINCIVTPGTTYGSGTWFSIAPLLYQNGGTNPKQGPPLFWHQYTAPTTRANLWFGFTFQVVCAAGDYLQPGYNFQSSSGVATIAGESTGMQTYWEVAWVSAA